MAVDAPVWRPPQVEIELSDPLPENGTIGRKELIILGTGIGAAVVANAIPFIRFIFSALLTLFHEFGHAVVGWLMGHPSLPAFDMMYGGGFTHYGMWRLSIVIAIGAGIIWLGWFFRENRKLLVIIVTFGAIWLVFVTSEWRRGLIMGAAGHLSEFILSGILFYQALSGLGFRSPDIERPLGAFVAAFVTINGILFARRLRSDAEFLAWYREGKGGMLMNDLESVALDLKIHLGWDMTIERVAGWLLAFSVFPFVIAIVWHLQRARWHSLLRRHSEGARPERV